MSRSVLRSVARVLTALVCVLAIAVPTATAKPVTTTFKDVTVVFNKVNAGDANATSVYIKFEGGVTKFNSEVRADDFTVTPLGAGGEFQLTAKQGKSIADGGTLTVRVKTAGGTLKGVRLGDVIFQDGAMKPLANGKASGGTLHGDPIYTLYNDLETTSNLTVTNLHFYFDHLPVDWATLDPATPISGSYTPAADAILSGQGSFREYTVPPIADGMMFLAQGDVMSNGVLVAQFVDGFEVSAVPEPATLSLMALGTLVLLARRHRHRTTEGATR